MKNILSILLCLALAFTCTPAIAFADDGSADGDGIVEEETDVNEMTGYEEVGFSEGLADDALADLDIGSGDELLDKYMLKEARGSEMRALEKSPRAWNMSGKDLIYYNKVKSLASSVASGSQSLTYTKFAGSQVLSKTKFTASDLGLSKVAYLSNGKLVLTEDAKKKINQMLGPDSWLNVMESALLDMPYELYWYNRVDGSNCLWKAYWYASFTTKTITIDTSASKTYCELYLPLIADYAIPNGSQYFIYRANTSKTRAVGSAVNSARAIVAKHEGESDYSKLRSYLDEVCDLTDYDYDAYEMSLDPSYENYQVYNSPWQMISVFDGDPATKVVCAGYGKAFKFLCDISSFRSNWVECQTMYGTIAEVINGKEVDPGNHLWCTVRMNDGKNYIVDPTWYDGTTGYYLFLQGGSGGSDYCNVETYRKNDSARNAYTIRYTDADWMKDMFSKDELAIAKEDYDTVWDAADSDRPISISSARITGKGLTYTGSPLTDEHPVVKVDGRTLKEGVDYLVTAFSNNTNVGKASLVITGIGQYEGSKSGTFSILPKNTAGFSLKKGRKSIKVSWKKQSQKMSKARITGYQIQYSTSKTFKSGNKSVKVKGYRKASKTVKGLKAKKTYYVRIRTYKTISGKTYYSLWSSAKSVRTR